MCLTTCVSFTTPRNLFAIMKATLAGENLVSYPDNKTVHVQIHVVTANETI